MLSYHPCDTVVLSYHPCDTIVLYYHPCDAVVLHYHPCDKVVLYYRPCFTVGTDLLLRVFCVACYMVRYMGDWSLVARCAPTACFGLSIRGLSPTECMLVRSFFFCIKIDRRKAREYELAIFDENRREVGMLNPKSDKNVRTKHVSGGRNDIYNLDLSRRLLRVEPP